MSSLDRDMQALQSLRNQFSQALKEFASSSASFRILHTIPPTSAPSEGKPISTRTLYVLDSSFNPPSKAHSSLVKTALKSYPSTSEKRDQNFRVLFLLATVNADKKPKPADFEDRTVMMALAAEDLRLSFASASSSEDLEDSETYAPIIDIGITKLPYFVDKASSIESSNIYHHPDQEHGVVEQVHLTGFDTLLRIFTPKYYPDHNPPLSALEPFLKYHRVKATIRVDSDSPSENLKDAQKTQSSSSPSGGDVEDPLNFSTTTGQKNYLKGIKNGSLEKEGMKKEWAEQVELVIDESGEAEGVSSTRVRNAVQDGNWDAVTQLVGPNVGQWIKDKRLYLEGDKGGRL
jgi:nicotinamide-nucleotide adenylyltransferase